MASATLEVAGYGSGSGDGFGAGSGFGSGFGSGYGFGSGSGLLAQAYAAHPFVATASVAEDDVTFAFWRSDVEGRSANGGQAGESVYPGLVQEVDGPLRLCSKNALHASLNPGQWQGDRWWVVALVGPTKSDGNKIGALKRIILEELV